MPESCLRIRKQKAKQELVCFTAAFDCLVSTLYSACTRPSSWRRRCSPQSPCALPDPGHSPLRRWASSPRRKVRGLFGIETRQRTPPSPTTPTTPSAHPSRSPFQMAWGDIIRLSPTPLRRPVHTLPRTQTTPLPLPLPGLLAPAPCPSIHPPPSSPMPYPSPLDLPLPLLSTVIPTLQRTSSSPLMSTT